MSLPSPPSRMSFSRPPVRTSSPPSAVDEVAQARAGDGVRRVGALHARQAGLDDDAQRRRARQRHRAQPAMGERAHERERRAAAVGVVDAHAVGRPARRPGAATRAEAPHAMSMRRRRAPPASPPCAAPTASVSPSGEAATAPPTPVPRRSGCFSGLRAPWRTDVQAPRRADPGARAAASKATPAAPLTFTRRSSLGPADGHHRDAAVGRGRRPPAFPARESASARAVPCRPHAVADGQRPGVEDEEPPAGGRVDARAARRDGDPDRRGRRGRG